ncbi:2'-5' RNA ligase family protein [Pseudomonas sp. ML96]|uniref:2'-5' RNA ligase family protein n=1 Tax=Pseudomonas sp. ML96 TaxID=1523503 RepID=UPI00068E39D6|nr:2'-5' RNA ligase family protein [Pseudomonas sp. ML96]
MRLFDPLHAPAATLPSELHDHPEWHLGRERYWLWSIPVQCPAVLQRLQRARELLGDWLYPPGSRQAHITLFVCGFATPSPVLNDDIATAQLEGQRDALASLQLAPFELHIGGLDSFASAAFLGVQDSGPLDQLRQTLAQLSPEVRQTDYVPHLTLGLYRQAIDLSHWRRRAEPLRHCPALTLPVRELQLLSYATNEPQGTLRVEARVVLG